MNLCRSTLNVDVYDVVPWQSPGGTTFHDVNGAKLSWLAVCILAVITLTCSLLSMFLGVELIRLFKIRSSLKIQHDAD